MGAGSLYGAAPSRGWLPRGGGSLERPYNPNGLTPFDDQMGHSYHGKLFQWGQSVLVRQPSALDQPKMDARWIAGIWMGRRPEAGDHMVAVGDGCILCGRSCRAVIPSEVSLMDYKESIELLKLWVKPTTADDVIVFSGGPK